MKPGSTSTDSPPFRKASDKKPQVHEERIPPQVPDHELLRLIGAGSYGSVWLARNSMGVFRAVKIVYRDTFSDDRPFERELTGIKKFEPISRSHEGFVDILHVGLDGGRRYFFYVMELGDDEISGQNIDPELYRPKTLGKQIAVNKILSFVECVEFGLALTKALAELHKRLLVHRDVKPANIIFINGIPKLADIGLVTDIHDAGSYVGTTGFIPPEGPGKPQADIYSLGKVLYEASTGKDRQEFPELPTLVESWDERDAFVELNEVILRACQNDPARRYPSAWDMHADLVVLSNGKSVKRLRTLERRVSNIKRIRAFFLASVLILAAIFFKLNRERAAVKNARRSADITYGSASAESGDLFGALRNFGDLLSVDTGDQNRTEIDRLRLGSILRQSPKLIHFWSETNILGGGEFSPDGKRVLISEFLGKAGTYDLSTEQRNFGAYQQESPLKNASYSHDGKFVVTANVDGTVCIWDALTFRQEKCFSRPQHAYCAKFSPDGNSVVAGYGNGLALVWDVKTGAPKIKLEAGGAIQVVDFSRDGLLIVTGSKDHRARIWNSVSGAPVCPPLVHDGWIYAASFSPDGKSLVTASGDHRARVWNVATGQRISPDLIHGDAVTSAEFSPDGRLILTASLDGTVRLWSVDDFEPYMDCPFVEKGERVNRATFSKERPQVLTVSVDGTIRIWDIAGDPLKCIPDAVFDRPGDKSLTILRSKIKIFETATGALKTVVDTREPNLRKAMFSSNGRFLVTVAQREIPPAGSQSALQVWETDFGNPLTPPLIVSEIVTGASLSDDAKHLIVLQGQKASIWSVGQQKQLCALPEHSSEIREAFFSPNGKQVVTVNDRKVNVWHMLDGTPVFSPLVHTEPVKHAEYSADGSKIISCCTDPSYNSCYAQVWRTDTGATIGPPLNHRDGVLFATLSPDGRTAATAGEDFAVIIWNVLDGKQIALMRHKEKVDRVAFSHDGKMLISASLDHTARIWDVETGSPLTAPLIQANALSDAQFLANNLDVVLRDNAGRCYQWRLDRSSLQLKSIESLTETLNENHAASSIAVASNSAQTSTEAWDHLRQQYPVYFQESLSNSLAWSEIQAEESESANQWFAAAYHLRRLLAYQPNDAALTSRLQRANHHLQENP